MNTRERLLRYRELLAVSSDAAREFYEQNRETDQRFASLVDFHTAMMEALDKVLATE